jgi:23S rRNA (pseudouridine1915-N3)-methyltransferase
VRIVVAAVGRLKDGAERELLDRYLGRARAAGRSRGFTDFDVLEFAESRAIERDRRRREEAAQLSAATRAIACRIVLDEAGAQQSSRDFAARLARERDSGAPALAFLVGGPDGHDASLAAAATMRLSLGPMTLPHGLARIVLAEQLYRAVTILAGHPYHRD